MARDPLYDKLFAPGTGCYTWAEEFMRVAKEATKRGEDPLELHFLAGWFGNAMQKGSWDERREMREAEHGE